MHRHLTPLLLLLIVLSGLPSCKTKQQVSAPKVTDYYKAPYHPQKHELRAVWMATVYHQEYTRMTPDQMRKYLSERIAEIKNAGFNTLIFQVRPESDAFYKSNLEPWSRFLTGLQGSAPDPLWDPMEFLIEECHKRGLEFHAWLNPYRASADNSVPTHPTHPISRHPEWFLTYGKLTLYNPGVKACRDFIVEVVSDIVRRYDVDAIHMDDYFYPYPIAGLPFPDSQTYQEDPRGFQNIQDWRRDNVNQLIRAISHAIRAIKPYVRLGISPFGIYRNHKSDPKGSQTNGLQNYDDLFADILLWDRMGWIDYVMPQLYWQMGHKAADYTELAYWWKRNLKNSHYYIGQSVRRTMDADQLHPKLIIANETAEGNCMWPGEDIANNYKGIRNALERIYWRYPSLVPPSYDKHGKYTYPSPISHLRTEKTGERVRLLWDPPANETGEGGLRYVIYYYEGRKTKQNLSDPRHILTTTRNTYYDLPTIDGRTNMIYFVTSLNRYNCESLEAPYIRVKH